MKKSLIIILLITLLFLAVSLAVSNDNISLVSYSDFSSEEFIGNWVSADRDGEMQVDNNNISLTRITTDARGTSQEVTVEGTYRLNRSGAIYVELSGENYNAELRRDVLINCHSRLRIQTDLRQDSIHCINIRASCNLIQGDWCKFLD